MVTLAFDTLKAAKALREAGFEEAQAEARTGLQAHVGAVRADVAALEARLFRHPVADGRRHCWRHGDAGEADPMKASRPLDLWRQKLER